MQVRSAVPSIAPKRETVKRRFAILLGWMRESLWNAYWEMLAVLVWELLEVLGLRGINKGLLRLHLIVDHLGMLLNKL